ncbi:TonB-dependent receptor [Solitalea longa]|uniref:TonB-dependent receptor n=1 Tax=Solitalea longa TaxID=2079460 RepID=A0A2S5A2M4_9SPHI|nr:TonB-dependent receptor [Solitalea longa]POY36532.1 TonB-dependent receptor [Solitalea longa]
MNRKIVLLIIFTLLSTQALKAQVKLREVLLNKYYRGSLASVFDSIAVDHNLKFSFDRERLRYSFAERYADMPLDVALKYICKDYELKYYIGAGNVIFVLDKNQKVDPKTMASGTQEIGEKAKVAALKKNYLLTGRVVDAASGESLPYVNITIVGTKQGTATNADGYFTLNKVPTDTSTLFISYLGYHKTSFHLNPDLPKAGLIIELNPDNELEEVLVVADKEDLMKVSEKVSMIKISPQKLAMLPNVGEKDIMRSFQLMPGVSASNESSSGLYVRGGTPDQNLVVYDGFTVYQVDHLYGFYSAFNSNAIKDVQLYKGGFEPKYGGRLSSVTEITGKDGNSKGFNVGGDISLLSINAYLESPFGENATLLLAARRSYKGPLYNKIFNKFNSSNSTTTTQRPGFGGGPRGNASNFATTVSSYFYDLNGKFTYKVSKKDALSLSLYNGTDNLDNSQEAQAPSFGGGGFGGSGRGFGFNVNDVTNYGNMGGSLRWTRKWSDRFFSTSVLSYSNYYSDRDRSNENTLTDEDGNSRTIKNGTIENNDLKDFSFKTDLEYAWTKDNAIKLGAYATNYKIKYNYSQNDTSTILDRNTTGNLAGIYIQDKQNLLGDKLSLEPGLRFSYFDQTSKGYIEPRFSANYRFNSKVTFKAATGKYYQFANRVVREDVLSGSRDFWILSDGSNVPVSSAIHYIIGASYETRQYLFSAEYYYKDLNGVTEYSLRFNPTRGGGPGGGGGAPTTSYEENFFSGVGYSQGIEFLIQKKVGNYNGWISYSLGEARNKIATYGDDYYSASQDVTHELKIVNIYKLGRWNFSGDWVFATGRPYTAPQGGYELTLLDGTTQSFINIGAKNGSRLPNYHRLDLAVNYELRGADAHNNIGSIGVSFFNVYNRKNVWYKEFQIADNQVVETNVNYLGFTPNLTLTLKLR